MARTSAGELLTEQHRTEQISIRAAALSEVGRTWSMVNPTDLSGTINPWAQTAAALAEPRWRESAEAAQRYYGRFRAVEGIGDTAPMVPEHDRERSERLLRGAALSGILNARRQGLSADASMSNGHTKMSGQTTSLVLAGSRNLLLDAAHSDPEATGNIARITSGDPCAFCAMTASLGFFDDDDFETHDHCGCSMEVEFPGASAPASSQRFRDIWDSDEFSEETRAIPGANSQLNAFRRILENRRVT